MLFGVVAIAGIDAGDTPPTADAVTAWLGETVTVARCDETSHRLPARDPVTVYRCDVFDDALAGSGCFGVDEDRVVAGPDQLAHLDGCNPTGALAETS